MVSAQRSLRLVFHNLHAMVLSFPIALFSAALATDISYLNTAEIQWTNFSSWLIAGALVFGGALIAFALLGWILNIRRPSGRVSLIYLLVVIIMWGIGLVNAFQHSRDAWSSVGSAGLAMSIVCTLMALIAGWMLFSRPTAWEIDR